MKKIVLIAALFVCAQSGRATTLSDFLAPQRLKDRPQKSTVIGFCERVLDEDELQKPSHDARFEASNLALRGKMLVTLFSASRSKELSEDDRARFQNFMSHAQYFERKYGVKFAIETGLQNQIETISVILNYNGYVPTYEEITNLYYELLAEIDLIDQLGRRVSNRNALGWNLSILQQVVAVYVLRHPDQAEISTQVSLLVKNALKHVRPLE